MVEIIACFVGLNGSGKSSLANGASLVLTKDVRNVYTTVLSFAEPVKRLAKQLDCVDLFDDATKRSKRNYLIALAEGVKDVTNNRFVWSDVLSSKALNIMHDAANDNYAGTIVLIDDLRFAEEYVRLRELSVDHIVVFNVAKKPEDLYDHDKLKQRLCIQSGEAYIFDVINVIGYEDESIQYVVEEIKQLLTCQKFKAE